MSFEQMVRYAEYLTSVRPISGWKILHLQSKFKQINIP